jgi:pentapeptide repeat protein
MTQAGQLPAVKSRVASIPPSRPSAEHVRALEAAGLLEVRLIKKSAQRPLMSVWEGEDRDRERVLLTVVDACGVPAERDRVVGAANALMAFGGTVGVQNIRRVLADVDAFVSDFHGAGTAADLVVLRLPTVRKLDFACRLCDALAALHDAGLTHGCLCPDNILLDDDLHPVVTEAGMVSIAESLDGDRENVFGYGAYASPEAARGAPDARGDVFSVGRLLTFIMLDRTPGETVDVMDVNARDPAVAAIVRRCTGEASERYESMAALATALRHYKHVLVPSEGETAHRPVEAAAHARALRAPSVTSTPRPTVPRKTQSAVRWAAPWWVAAIGLGVVVVNVLLSQLDSLRSLHSTLAAGVVVALVSGTTVVPATKLLRVGLALVALWVALALDPIGRLSQLDASSAPTRAAAARAYVQNGGKDLRGLHVENADLSGLDLTGAQLGGADLTSASLAMSKLSRAHVDGAAFLGVHLEGADLGDVVLEKAFAVETATCDDVTVLPGGWYCSAARTVQKGPPPVRSE